MPRRKPAPGNQKIAIGYCRMSTQDQTLSIEAQQAAMQRWADSRGVRIVATFADEGISGAAVLEDRPALLDAINALQEHHAGVLLVQKRDRLARDVLLAGAAEALVERAGAHVVSCDGVGEEDTPTSVLLKQILDAFSQFERAQIRARTRAALQAKRARGERVSSSLPYGFRLGADGKRLEPVEHEQRAITRARELRAEGLSLRAVGARLLKEGHAPRGRSWDPKTIARFGSAA